MSRIKRYIDDLKMRGQDPLNEDHEDFVDDSYWYNLYCHYSGLPAVTAYIDRDEHDDEND